MQALFYKLLYIFLLLLPKPFCARFQRRILHPVSPSTPAFLCAVSLLSTYMYPVSMASLPTDIPILTGIFSMVCSFIGYAKQRPVRTTVMRCNGNADAADVINFSIQFVTHDTYRSTQCFVTGLMTEDIIHLFKSIQVQEEQRAAIIDSLSHDRFHRIYCFKSSINGNSSVYH